MLDQGKLTVIQEKTEKSTAYDDSQFDAIVSEIDRDDDDSADDLDQLEEKNLKSFTFINGDEMPQHLVSKLNDIESVRDYLE